MVWKRYTSILRRWLWLFVIAAGMSASIGWAYVAGTGRGQSDVWVYISVAALAGFLWAIVGTFGIEYVTDNIRVVEDLTHITGAPVLGVIPTSRRGPYSFLETPGTEGSSVYRTVGTSLFSANDIHYGRAVLVCSPQSTPLTAQAAANLGMAYARLGHPTLLIDADRTEGQLTRALNLEGLPGFADALSNPGRELMLHLMPAVPNMSVLPAGAAPSVEPVTFSLPYLRNLVERSGAEGSMILLAGPPVGPSALLALSLAKSVHNVVLVAVKGETRRRALRRSVQILQQSGILLSGILLMERPASYNYEDVAGAAREVRRSNFSYRVDPGEGPYYTQQPGSADDEYQFPEHGTSFEPSFPSQPGGMNSEQQPDEEPDEEPYVEEPEIEEEAARGWIFASGAAPHDIVWDGRGRTRATRSDVPNPQRPDDRAAPLARPSGGSSGEIDLGGLDALGASQRSSREASVEDLDLLGLDLLGGELAEHGPSKRRDRVSPMLPSGGSVTMPVYEEPATRSDPEPAGQDYALEDQAEPEATTFTPIPPAPAPPVVASDALTAAKPEVVEESPAAPEPTPSYFDSWEATWQPVTEAPVVPAEETGQDVVAPQRPEPVIPEPEPEPVVDYIVRHAEEVAPLGDAYVHMVPEASIRPAEPLAAPEPVPVERAPEPVVEKNSPPVDSLPFQSPPVAASQDPAPAQTPPRERPVFTQPAEQPPVTSAAPTPSMGAAPAAPAPRSEPGLMGHLATIVAKWIAARRIERELRASSRTSKRTRKEAKPEPIGSRLKLAAAYAVHSITARRYQRAKRGGRTGSRFGQQPGSATTRGVPSGGTAAAPGNPDVLASWLERAEQARQRGNIVEARELVNWVLDRDPRNEEAWHLRLLLPDSGRRVPRTAAVEPAPPRRSSFSLSPWLIGALVVFVLAIAALAVWSQLGNLGQASPPPKPAPTVASILPTAAPTATGAPASVDVSGPFLTFWGANGGPLILGNPISPRIEEQAADGSTLEVQYFERARLEAHPENPDPASQVTLGRLGAEVPVSGTLANPLPEGLRGDAVTVKGTGYEVPRKFYDFWQSNNGSVLFGSPLTPVLNDVTLDGKPVVVQYFERARFEYHPELAGKLGEVQLTDLGSEVYAVKHPH